MDPRHAEAADLWRRGWTQRAIAAHLGVSNGAVSNWLKDSPVRRPPGRRPGTGSGTGSEGELANRFVPPVSTWTRSELLAFRAQPR